jgi:hypothetical protein
VILPEIDPTLSALLSFRTSTQRRSDFIGPLLGWMMHPLQGWFPAIPLYPGLVSLQLSAF